MAQTGYTPIKLYYSATTTNLPLAANLAAGELAINTVDGKLFYKDSSGVVQVIGWKVTPATAGGTGQTSYAVGDILYAPTTTTVGKLADVATGNALISGGVGVVPSYGKIGLTTHVSGVLPAVNGGTGQSSYAVGDILYAPTTTTVGSIADVATGNVLISGGVGVVPSYGKVGLTTHVSGTLPVANGGTGVTTSTGTGNVVLSNSPTLVTPALGTPTALVLTSATGLPLTTGVTGALPVANGGTGATTAAVARTNLGLGTIATYNAAVANGAATLDASGTLTPSQIPAGFGPGMTYQGTWDASTNTPTLVSSVGTSGYFYIVSVAGSTTLNGISSWAVGDYAVFGNSVWRKYPAVLSPYLIQADIGTAPNQIPLNQYLGTMAYQDENSVNIQGGTLTNVTASPANIAGYQLVANSYPSTPASLILDFANSKTLDPRITFTRASTATYYDGVTSAVAEQNLFLQSQTFDNAAWAKIDVTITANSVAAPDGTTTADTVTLSAGTGIAPRVVVASNIAGAASTSVVSVFAKASTQNFIQITNNAGTAYHCNFDVSAGTVGTSNNCTGTITSFGSGWYRCSVVCTPTNTADIAARFNLVSSSSAVKGETWNPVGTEVIYIWGAQMEQRSAITAYTPTTTAAITNYIPVLQTAASGVARLDYNPTTGESLGLLIEEARTNLVTYSEQFDDAAWVKSGASVTTNTIVSPDGAIDGDKLVENTALTDHLVTQSLTKAASAITYTLSCYIKSSERNVKLVLDGGSNSNRVDAFFDLTSGTIIVAAAAVGTFSSPVASITSVGNGWYRCTLTGTTGTETTLRSRIWMASGVLVTYTGDGYSGAFIWGAQLEVGAFATSYIPTVAASVLRPADAASVTGTNFSSWYNIAQGSLYGEAVTGTTSVLAGVQPYYVATLRATTSDAISMGFNSVSGTWNQVYVGNANVVNIGAPSVANSTNKVAFSFTTNNFAVSSNGASASTDSSGDMPTVNALYLGENRVTSKATLWLKRVAYYPVALTSAQLQALTT